MGGHRPQREGRCGSRGRQSRELAEHVRIDERAARDELFNGGFDKLRRRCAGNCRRFASSARPVSGRPATVAEGRAIPHSVDVHSARIAPNKAAFTDHCGTKPVLMHIADEMYGAIVVDPKPGVLPNGNVNGTMSH